MIVRIALRNLRRNIRRTATIILTVSFGVSSLFIFHGFNAGIMNQYQDNTVHSRYGHGQINIKGYREKVFEKPWEHWIDDWNIIQDSLKDVPGVLHLFPRTTFFALLTNGKITVSGKGQGIDGKEEAQFFNTLNVISGKTLSTQEDGILLGRGLARALDVKVGDRVTVLANTIYGSMNGADLYVTGIFHTGSKDFDDVMFRIPLNQAQILLDTKKVESVAIGLKSVENWPKVSQIIQNKHPNLEATPFAVLDKVYYQHSVDWLDSQFGVIQIIILTIVLLGIFNTVATGVLERKQEIGNLRANGDSAGDVIKMLSLEGVFLGVAGAIGGVLIGLLVTYGFLGKGILMPPAPGLTRQFHVFIELQPIMAFWTVLMGIGAATIGTFLAGLKLARMPIGEALRSL